MLAISENLPLLIKIGKDSGIIRLARISAWGAFAYGLTKTVFDVLDMCGYCPKQRRGPDGNCPYSTKSLAMNVGITVTGFLLGIGAYGKRGTIRVIAMKYIVIGLAMVLMYIIYWIMTVICQGEMVAIYQSYLHSI